MDDYQVGDISNFLNSASSSQKEDSNKLFLSKYQASISLEKIYVNAKPPPLLGKRPKKVRAKADTSKEPEILQPDFPKLTPEEQLAIDKRTIFIGNLPVGLKRKQLRKIFDEFGKIESLRFRSVAISDLKLGRKVCLKSNKINENATSKNAYVVFKDEEGVAKSLTKNGLNVNEHHIRVDKLVKSKVEVENDSKNSIFIGNIPFAATEEDIRTALSQCGDIDYVRMPRDPKTNIGKGFGYVKFADLSGVMLAMKVKDTVEITGRKLRLQRCKSKNALEHKKNAKEVKAKKDLEKQSKFRGRKSKDSDKEMFIEKKTKSRSKGKNSKANPESRPKIKKQKTVSQKKFDKKVNKKSNKRTQGPPINTKTRL